MNIVRACFSALACSTLVLSGCSTTPPKTIQLEVVAGAAQNVTRITSAQEDEIRPVVSPDGARVAFQIKKGDQFDILTMGTNGLARTQVTNEPGNDFDPVWTPDSRSIVFSSDRLGRLCLWRKLATGGGGTTMVTHGLDTQDFAPTVSLDGTICFTARATGEPKQVIEQRGPEVYAVFRKALPYVWTVAADGTSLTQIADGVFPAWSGDASRIAYCSDVAGNWDIWTMNRDGSGRTQLTSDSKDQISPCYSPDGKWLAYVSNESKSGSYDLWIMRTDGSLTTQLTTDPGDEMWPSWGADGHIYFCSKKSGNWDIWRLKPVLPQ